MFLFSSETFGFGFGLAGTLRGFAGLACSCVEMAGAVAACASVAFPVFVGGGGVDDGGGGGGGGSGGTASCAVICHDEERLISASPLILAFSWDSR